MREVLTAFVVPYFCALIADDTGLIFKVKKYGKYHAIARLRYSRIEFVEFRGSNIRIHMKNGATFKAAVLQKKRLIEIFNEKDVSNFDKGFRPV